MMTMSSIVTAVLLGLYQNPICASELMELACIVFWSVEVSGGKSMEVLVMTDHFSKNSRCFTV